MKIKSKKIHRPLHRLFIRVIDHEKPIRIDENGNKFHFTKEIEVSEANIGSAGNPNKEIISIRFEPIEYESDREEKNKDPLRWFK